MSNKELILKTAINLFNELGTAKVTTNLIAKEAGISPGNLYYHFTDKEHIIREVFNLMAADWDSLTTRFSDRNSQFEDFLKEFVLANFELLWKYRFFSREMVPLINVDQELRERHIPVINEHFNQQVAITRMAEKAGILIFPDPEFQALDALTISWIVANQYLIHLEGMGKVVEKADFDRGAQLIINFMRPYLTRVRHTIGNKEANSDNHIIK